MYMYIVNMYSRGEMDISLLEIVLLYSKKAVLFFENCSSSSAVFSQKICENVLNVFFFLPVEKKIKQAIRSV